MDLLDNSGNLLPQNELQNIMGTNVTWYDYTIIKLSIKKYFNSTNISLPVAITRPVLPLHLKPIIKSQKGCKDFYNVLNNKTSSEIIAISKWNAELGFNLSKENWEHIFKLAHHTIQDNTFKWFQFKIIHRILGTKSLTFKMGTTQTNQCGLCHNSEETLLHLFTQCNVSQVFWLLLINTLMTSVT